MSERELVISGPCSAESEEQLFSTAEALCQISTPDGERAVTALRAGLWKPRTHPDTFEGVGEAGIPWLVRVQEELGLDTAVEVATPAHIEKVVNAGIKMIWIGARTTTNPFLMQEIASALQGSDIPVLVKNPVNPDLELWIGAIERLQKAGVKSISAIHRGFSSSYERGKYRNAPMWQLPIEMKRHFPQMKMLCDPSHIAGDRAFLLEISQRAMDMGFDGLFIESHISPECALSDSKQQITPSELAHLLDNIVRKNESSDNIQCLSAIETLRERIDVVDKEIIDLLASRMELVEQIGKYKKEANITVYQHHRWEEVLSKVTSEATKKGLDKKFVEDLFNLIHQAAIKQQ